MTGGLVLACVLQWMSPESTQVQATAPETLFEDSGLVPRQPRTHRKDKLEQHLAEEGYDMVLSEQIQKVCSLYFAAYS